MENQGTNRSSRVRGAFYKPYSKERIDVLKRLIENFESQEKTKHYSIIIDGEMVVSKGSSSESFDDYESFLDETTERVEVRLYQGESPNFKLHVFELKERALNGFGAVNPQSIEEHVAKALEKRELELELENLRKELKRKSKKLRRYKDNDEESSGLDLNGIVTKGMEIFGNMNAKKDTTENTPIQGLEATQVEFESKSTESDKYFQNLKNKYSEKELIYAVRLWELLMQYPELGKEFKAIIESKIENNGKTHD